MSDTESLHEYVIRQLNDNKGRWPAIAESSGVARSTIAKIARREVENPGVLHVEKLAKYFREHTPQAA
jgi:transcriptional regulator with XRE-family HTH domain